MGTRPPESIYDMLDEEGFATRTPIRREEYESRQHMLRELKARAWPLWERYRDHLKTGDLAQKETHAALAIAAVMTADHAGTVSSNLRRLAELFSQITRHSRQEHVHLVAGEVRHKIDQMHAQLLEVMHDAEVENVPLGLPSGEESDGKAGRRNKR